ncbi:MAG: NINE protein [Cellvibrio sp.]|uniref:NINE protein n=1 Tax=Cellvibrio sp. TaxID=1965322 RepID=UPI0031A89756
MSEVRLDVYLLGEPQPGIDRSTLVRNLATTFKKEVPVIEKMLRKSRSLLKSNIDAATAAKYKAAILKAGGQCELVNHGEQLFPTDALSPVAARPTLTIAPVEPTQLTSAPDESASGNTDYSSPYSTPETNSESTEHFCYKCGRSITSGLTQCPYCRAPQIQFNSKSKVTAGFLAFFLGGFGAHRFYLGQWWGIFYVIFWATLIPSIVALVESFVFWFSSNERWNQKYGQVPAATPGLKAAIAVAVFFAFIFVVGILASISLPAYMDYTARAKVQASLPLINETRQKVTEVIKQKDFFPSENILAGLPEVISSDNISSIALSEGAKMVVTFNIPSLNDGRNTIVWTPAKRGGDIVWDCKSGTMPDKYRMPECRGGEVDVASSEQGTAAVAPANKRFYSDDKKISLSVPSAWQENRRLNPAAILGVSNSVDEVYVMVLREPKTNFSSSISLGDYTGFIYTGLETTVPGLASIASTQDLSVNGLPAKQQYLSATMGGNDIVYAVTTVEGAENFYAIYSSTAHSRFEKNKAILLKVSESFAEHN